ncbi:MAG: phosphoribosylformylglycinamidine cyclo-ligase, partial [Betaproteobacteria bacterium]|nr:phosphoribosylformylglycinamidine cyclo-ligase [Betaproteobacteria bacterium]NCZ29647.1 phosphoribosylformylglycinamidine cyclo-ligase [Betaproteobacteria bacterium]
MASIPGSQAPLRYKDAGVDIDAGDALVERIKPLAQKTMRAGVLAGIGGFGALFEVPRRYREPVLVAGTDGVGTKLRMAFALDRHDSVGIDLVAMSVNDILVQGAEPLFFLDYFACGKLEVGQAEQVIAGIARGCELACCALIGGETAEMPDSYPDGEYDLAGFAVGVVEKSCIVDGSSVKPGDRLLGIASSGLHSNGFSLVRRVLMRRLGGISSELLSETIGSQRLDDALMTPTRIYVASLLAPMQAGQIKALAHITGGGIVGNLPRVLPQGCAAILDRRSWPKPPVFDWLQEQGGIETAEMDRVFNNGLGMIAVVDADQADALQAALSA